MQFQSSKSLSDILKKDGNNFDVFRLLAALGVIIGHAYAIHPQPPLQDGISGILHFDYSGSLAVKFFFFLSGLLVTNSIIAQPDPFRFMIKRACRIFPGLLVCLLISVFIVGPLFTKLPLFDYFSNHDTWSYLKKNLLLYDLQWRLPGVFDQSKYGLNGSLWTLPHEVLCYLYLAVLFGLGLLRNKPVANIFYCLVIAACFLSPQYMPRFFTQSQDSVLLPACFSLGALTANNKAMVRVSLPSVILLFVLIRLLSNAPVFQFAFYIFFFYTILYISSIEFVKKRLRLPFDASYGVYIYGFMIQQCLHALFPNMGLHLHQLIAGLIAIVLGISFWYLVEQRFILLGHKLTRPEFTKVRTSVINGAVKLYGSATRRLQHSGLFLFFMLTAIALMVHALVLRFVFPGYYSPLVPQHSDFYIPAAFAHSSYSFADLLKWPRPVNMIAAKLFGYFGIHGSIACVILVGAMICALSALLIKKVLDLSMGWYFLIVFAAYCYLVFSEPFFYTFFTQDIGAQVSYLLLIIGACAVLYLNARPVAGNVILFSCSLLAFLSKETYGLTALLIAFLSFLYGRKRSFWPAIAPCISIFLAICVTALINLSMKSGFVDPNASANSPYHISLNPFSIIHEWLLYAGEALNLLDIALLLVIAGYICLLNKQDSRKVKFLYVVIACITGSVVSWLPNALLPNHHFKGYSFNGAFLLYLPLFFLPLMPFPQKIYKGLPLALLFLCLVSPLLNRSKYDDNKWVLIQEDTQRNLLGALKRLIGDLPHTSQPQKVLIDGITFPFHPFVFPQALRVFPNARYAAFDVVNYNPANPSMVNGVTTDLVRFIAPADTGIVQYQQRWIFDKDGNLVSQHKPLVEKVFDNRTDSGNSVEVRQDNFSGFTTSGFYNEESGIRWTNGNASIRLQHAIKDKDSIFVQLNTYMPPVCKDIYPQLTLLDVNGKAYGPAAIDRKADSFYFCFVVGKQDSISQLNIQSGTIDAASDTRVLSFPFVSLTIK